MTNPESFVAFRWELGLRAVQLHRPSRQPGDRQVHRRKRRQGLLGEEASERQLQVGS